jgi:hypothetical protein
LIDAKSVFFGVSWSDITTQTAKYQCVADENPFGWMSLDLEGGWGSQEVADGANNVRLILKYINNDDNLSWALWIKAEAINASLPSSLSLYHHLTVEAEEADLHADSSTDYESRVTGTYPAGSKHAGRAFAGYWLDHGMSDRLTFFCKCIYIFPHRSEQISRVHQRRPHGEKVAFCFLLLLFIHKMHRTTPSLRPLNGTTYFGTRLPVSQQWRIVDDAREASRKLSRALFAQDAAAHGVALDELPIPNVFASVLPNVQLKGCNSMTMQLRQIGGVSGVLLFLLTTHQ